MTTFRGFPACTCLVEWLPVYEQLLQERAGLVGQLRIYQLIGGAQASGGTHAEGGAFDITDLVGPEDVRLARQMGADATWARTRAQGFTPHLHGVLRGCPHNGPARYQIAAVDDGFNGLGRGGRGGRDDGPRPLSGRTWRQGIAWARRQMKELDVDEKTLRTILREEVGNEVADLARMEKIRSEKANERGKILRQLRNKIGQVDAETSAILDQLDDLS